MFSTSKSESKGASYTFDKKTKEEKEAELETGKLINKGLGWSNVKTFLTDMDIIGEGDAPQYEPTVGITERLQDAMTPSSDYQSWGDLKEYKNQFKEAKNKFKEDTGMDKDSDIWNYSMSMGYSSEKILATLGQGNIVVKDKDNSDDINGLNRNIDNMNNLLYSGGIGLDVKSVTTDPISRAVQTSITSIFDVQKSIQTISETGDTLNIAGSVLDIADEVFKIRDNVNTVNTVLNPPKENPKDNNKQNENTFADAVETTLTGLIKIKGGVKNIDDSVNSLINIDMQSLYLKENINSINSLIGGVQNIDEGLSQNNRVEKFLDNSHLRYYLDKIYNANKGIKNVNKFNPF